MAVGLVAAAGAGAVVAGDVPRARRWLHGAGLIDGPDLPPPGRDLRVDWRQLDSQHMGQSVDWGLWTPSEPVEAIVLCLHGRGANQRFAFDGVGVHRFVASADLPWAVASVDGGAASYWHPRESGADPQSMLFEELMPTLEDRLGPQPVVLIGWSMGGYGALLAAAERPDRVTAVAAASPALWHSFADSARGAFDDARDFAKHDVFARVERLRETRVRIDCGDDDPFIATSRALAAQLPNAEAEFGEGFHTAASWRVRVPRQLRFLSASLS